MLWIFLVSCICGIHPLFSAFRQAKRSGLHPKESKKHREQMKTVRQAPYSFSWYMARKYRHANRGHYIRITVTMIVAILLYVPAGYLIDANISAQQSGLYARYGIGYSCNPMNAEELEAALWEYTELDETGKENGVPESMLCVLLSATASVKADSISKELFKALRDAGWDKSSETETGLVLDATLLFVDNPTYMKCFRIADYAEEEKEISISCYPAILFNRYTNRSSRSEASGLFFQETSLLADKADVSSVEVYYDVTKEYEPDKTRYIIPDLVIDELPEGIDFNGSLFLILPLERMEEFCFSDIMYERLWVDGKWVDSDEEIFYSLEQCLGKASLGRLTYTRKILQEWYSSMKGIHLAMNAICLILFSAAIWNIFSMMVFQYMERKKGLAILWSTGQSMGGLLKILVIENIYHFLAAVAAGIPLSGLLCYYIYRIFRQAWQAEFTLPIRQIALLSVSALLVSVLALLLNGILMRHQDFLADMKEII